MAATCGNCKGSNQTVDHIRACYRARNEFGPGYQVVSDPHTFSGFAAVPGPLLANNQHNALIAQTASSPLHSARPSVTAILDTPAPRNGYEKDTWGPVNDLRDRVAKHVTHKRGDDRVGYFAVPIPDTDGGGSVIKFYRIKVTGNGRVYVDVQASDDFYPVKTPAALTLVLSRILSNPDAAKMAYARELGQCYECSRTLTDPESIRLGIGPVCRGQR